MFIRLCADFADDFFFQSGDAVLKLGILHVAQLSLDRVCLRVERDDLVFGGHFSGDCPETAFDETF
jgi:hypothetical protein